VTEWIPPTGMAPAHVRAWREFFRKAASGSAGYVAGWEDYVILYRAQLGRCYICQTARGINPADPKARGTQRLGWDHNHATGMVRGLLCTKGQWSCNRIVGRYRDSPDAFERAAKYLQSPPALVLMHSAPADYTLEQRAALATAILGVARDAAERANHRPRGIRGHSVTTVLLDEVVAFRE
jgi:hypothetical protein